MPGQTIFLTGGTDGLGRAVAHALSVRPDVRLLLHGRNSDRLSAIESELDGCAARVEAVLAELGDLRQVDAMVDRLGSRNDRITALINNAGIGEGVGHTREVSSDGYELRFAVNYLAAYRLTTRLFPLLDAGAPSRIVNVASAGREAPDFDDLTRHYSGRRAYARSKFALIAWGFDLADTLDPSQTTVNSLHPATYMPTKMVLESTAPVQDSLESGRDATLRLIEGPDVEGVTGRYYVGTTPSRAHPEAYRRDIHAILVRESEARVSFLRPGKRTERSTIRP